MMNDLESWRNVIRPRPEVAAGKFQDSEFMADLEKAAKGEGGREYTDSAEFFRRTYLTDGLRNLLVKSLRRLCGCGGDPVIQMKTAFGGGKTHSMLALYHLMSGDPEAMEMPEIRSLFKDAGVYVLPRVKTAVLACTNPDIAKPHEVCGIMVNTLWGDMAAQLGGYEYVREADRNSVSPGSEAFRRMFDECGPCLVLIDELVVYGRNLPDRDGLPAGTFDTFLAFLQHLTEAVNRSKNSLVVATLPESNSQAGGVKGAEILHRAEDIFGRLDAVWKPITSDEGFEIVRRRLFLECHNPEAREHTAEMFMRMYESNAGDFPSEAHDSRYRKQLIKCYPFHPELFERLYSDWATLEKFQKTRGVLKLMAHVVYELYTSGDNNALIMPGSLPLWDGGTRESLIRALPEHEAWGPIVEHDIDGEKSVALRLDTMERFASVSAARRSARAIMLGSAPAGNMRALRGIDLARIRLGTVQPGENVSLYNDAVNELKNELSYLYADEARLWFDTRPTLKRIAQELADGVKDSALVAEVHRRLEKLTGNRGVFSGVQVYRRGDDVPDYATLRLVVLGLDGEKRTAEDIIANNDGQPRTYQNVVVFLMADVMQLEGVRKTARRYLAWKMLNEDKESKNLTRLQEQEITASLESLDVDLDGLIRRAWIRVLSPYSYGSSRSDVKLDDLKIANPESGDISSNVAMCLNKRDRLSWNCNASSMLMNLDSLDWEGRDDIPVSMLWEWVCKFCYMPRLTSYEALEAGIAEGVKSGIFALASGEEDGRYTDLRMNEPVKVNGSDVIVKKEVAEAQLKPTPPEPKDDDKSNDNGTTPSPTILPDERKLKRKFHATMPLEGRSDPQRDLKKAYSDIIAELQRIPGARVRVSLEVSMDDSDGVPEDVRKDIMDNCKSLRTTNTDFY